MRYKIKKIESQEKKWERIILVALIMVYFISFILSEIYENNSFAEWVFVQYKKLPR